MDKTKDKKIINLFLKNPRSIGSIAASSPFLAKEIAKKIDLSSAKCVIELGSGTGSITKEILKKLPRDCTLLCFEIEPAFAKKLAQNIKDPRMKIVCDSAENIETHLKRFGFEKADCVVSGLPLASLAPQVTRSVLKNTYTSLRNGGYYVQFQYSLANLRQIRYLFSSIAISFVFLNFPPAFVYVCVKT